MAEPLRRAAFLDRDGTLIVEREYLADPDGVQLLPGAVEGLLALRRAGFALVLVTNQSGIARGFFRLEDYRAVHARLELLLRHHHVTLDGAYFCPHHPDFSGPCSCRKPAPGLYRQAAAELHLDLARSLFIGDRSADISPAQLFGGTGILVRTGYGPAHESALPPATLVLDTLADLAGVLAAVAS